MSELIASVTEKDPVLFLDLVAEVEGSASLGEAQLDASGLGTAKVVRPLT